MTTISLFVLVLVLRVQQKSRGEIGTEMTVRH